MDVKDKQPDPYSNEWYRRRLARLETTLDRQDNELKDRYATCVELRTRFDALEKSVHDRLADMQSKIGELIGRVEELETWMKEMERLRQLRNAKNGTAA